MMGDGGNLEKRTQVPDVELPPSVLVLRLDALLQDAYAAMPKTKPLERTELVQTVVIPARMLRGDLYVIAPPKQGWTLQVQFLEDRFNRKYRPKDEKRKKG